jgi:hypothetical protein
MRIITRPVLVCLVTALFGVTAHAGQPRREFIESWRGRRVEVKRALVTLVYDERGRLGRISRNKRAGLTVVTPLAGSYYQFDGRDSEQDLAARDPEQLVERIDASYLRDEPLDGGFFRRIEPRTIVRYEPGGALIVRDVRIYRDRVRLSFDTLSDDDPAGRVGTELTIRWPTDLSYTLTETPLIDALIRQFVERPETR